MTPEQRHVLDIAVRAPSVHNTQPWRFVVHGTTLDGLEVRADRSRLLAHQDPSGRELHISCGAAAWQAGLAVRDLGRDYRLDWLPDASDSDLLARLGTGGELPCTPEERALLQAVPDRHTDRSAFSPSPVAEELLRHLEESVAQEHARLTIEVRPDRVSALEGLASRAEQHLRRNDAIRQELGAWVRDEDEPADGVPRAALPDHGWHRASNLPLRDFDPQERPAQEPDDPPEAEHPLLALLCTDGDGPQDWLYAGAALGRLLLTATSRRLVANLQTQVLEVPGVRAQLVRELGLAGQPQVLVRLGHPAGPGSPRAGRRPLQDVVSSE